MPTLPFPGRSQHGMGLIELVVTLVILGILAAGSTAFVVRSVQGYLAARSANDLSLTAQMALSRMAREIRDAEAATVSANGSTLQFTILAPPPVGQPASPATSVGPVIFQATGGNLYENGPYTGSSSVLLAQSAAVVFTSDGNSVTVTLTLTDSGGDSLTLTRYIPILGAAYQ